MVGLTPGATGVGSEYGPVFHALNTISSVLSIAGSLLVIVTFLLFPQLRRYFARLVLYLAISDLWLCTSFLIGESPAPHYTKCSVQSLLGIFFGLASILWTVAIADSVRRVVLACDLSVESRHEGRLHMIAWGLPFLAIAAVLASRTIGPAGMMCWIEGTALGTILRLLTFYLPLWLGIGYSLWVYWCVSRMLHTLLDQRVQNGADDYEASAFEYQADLDRQRRSIRLMLYLPLILIFCWGPASLRRLLEIFFPGMGITALDYLCVLTGPLQGALNAIVYGSTPAVRDAMLGRIDQSARKIRGVQARLRGLHPGRRRNQKGFQQQIDEENSSPSLFPPALGSPPAGGGARSSRHEGSGLDPGRDSGPRPEQLGRPYAESPRPFGRAAGDGLLPAIAVASTPDSQGTGHDIFGSPGRFEGAVGALSINLCFFCSEMCCRQDHNVMPASL
ncbi:unnamed protein product [Polarella glacialis]|uniref:G-protein coupled receptors family 2 profile 2 domain-containing protein n=2 Tax=Polarella glacialis TaxID=89957 RepID=A0A813JVK5_POLGL|nr:unnamed protein product [Polarella glacialis]